MSASISPPAPPWTPEPTWTRLDRRAWTNLRAADLSPEPSPEELSTPIPATEVRQIYGPLVELVATYRNSTRELSRRLDTFLERGQSSTPFLLAVAGSVAVGKSTSAELLRDLLARLPGRPRVELVGTDGFLFPNRELEARGLMHRKGFPESYDTDALVRFLDAVKGGRPEIHAPRYSHRTYDVLVGTDRKIRRPDILVIEGINVLQTRPGICPVDFFDLSFYVDADPAVIRRWYIARFLRLQAAGIDDPDSYFHRFAHLDRSAANELAGRIWDEINGPNLEQHIAPTRNRADLVLEKGADHAVRRVLLRTP